VQHKAQLMTWHYYELVQDSLAESKTAHFSPFFTFFQLRSTGYAPSFSPFFSYVAPAMRLQKRKN